MSHSMTLFKRDFKFTSFQNVYSCFLIVSDHKSTKYFVIELYFYRIFNLI